MEYSTYSSRIRTLISIVLWLLYNFLSFKNDLNVPAFQIRIRTCRIRMILGLPFSVVDPKQKFRIRFRIRIRPEVSFGSGSSFGSGFESGFESRIWIRIRILDPDLDQKLAKFFFILKFLRSLIFKAALHQLCDLATNKVRKKLAIYEDLSYCLCIVSLPHAGEHKVHI